MTIQTLKISNFRNITELFIPCSPHFNLFFGDNAAGKTSLLEAIYYLGNARSFRSTQHDHVIQHNQSEFIIFAQLSDDNGLIPVGLQRSRDGMLRIHVQEDPVKSIAELPRLIPMQFISSDSHRILSDGPKCRRQFMDWGLFHTNPQFFETWKNFQRILIQRNAALKARASRDELLLWNAQFAAASEILNHHRKNYLIDFLPFFESIVERFLDKTTLTAKYNNGWDETAPLLELLNKNVSRETLIGHTVFGPHRADLSLTVNEIPVHHTLSQGQQKLLSYALRLAQGLHYHSIMKKSLIYLIDDLPSELDSEKRKLIIRMLVDLQAQVFITGIEHDDLSEMVTLHPESKMFHVEHGGMISINKE